MRFFCRSRNKSRKRKQTSLTNTRGSSFENTTSREPSPVLPETTDSTSNDVPQVSVSRRWGNQNLKRMSKDQNSLTFLPRLLRDLATAKHTSGEKPARALRRLFSLSEHGAYQENRTSMARLENGKLVPVLLDFLKRCGTGSSEQYLTLLVLNNVSIPTENKRLVALTHGGVQLLVRLLCNDPSCHLVAIVLVNLIFADAELRRELVVTKGVQLVESLAFALRVSSLTQEEYERRLVIVTNDPEKPRSPSHRLADLLTEDMRQRLHTASTVVPSPSKQLFPETARWCLTAIKHLTRPSKDTLAARSLIQCGIVPHILRFITVSSFSMDSHSTSYSDSPTSVVRGHRDRTFQGVNAMFTNAPSTWDSSSAQDAALFVVLNLSTSASALEYMRTVGTLGLLYVITVYDHKDNKDTEDEKQIASFQSLKARMALAMMLGSQGNYGQAKARTAHSLYLCSDDSLLLLSEKEAIRFVELLADTLHGRPKDGPGGYLLTTFTVRCVLFAIRCLLTNDWNQILFANVAGPRLNALLMKALAQHAVDNVRSIDEVAGEDAVFSLYLLSNYGFEDCFLPAAFGNKQSNRHSVAAKIWTAYLRTNTITSAGKHAAVQLLMRLKYLLFQGTAACIASSDRSGKFASDFLLSDDLTATSNTIHVEHVTPGAKPQKDVIFRSILRCRPPGKGSVRVPWDKYAAKDSFPSALLAVHELSFASTKVRHLDAVDDVFIANDIAKCANGEKTESYSFLWSWQDTAEEINRKFEKARPSNSFLIKSEALTALVRLKIGSLCAFDTTED